jgi:hypothetical protein
MESPRESGGFLFTRSRFRSKLESQWSIDPPWFFCRKPGKLAACSWKVGSSRRVVRSLGAAWAQLGLEIFVIYLLPNFSRFDLTFGKYALRLLHKPNGKTKGK